MKKIKIAILTLCFSFLFGTAVYAATSINEAEPNDTASEAQVIDRCNVNPATIVNGSYEGQNTVLGSIYSADDEDWYKVYLPADASTILSINSSNLSGTGRFEIYDQNINLITSVLYQKDYSVLGVTAYNVNIPTTGNYFIKVTSPLQNGDYSFTIGKPTYKLGDYTYNAPSACTITTTVKSAQATYNLTNVAGVPDGAIVYSLSISGTKTNSAMSESRSIKLATDSYWTSTSMYTYIANIPVISNKQLKNIWMFKLDGTVSKYKGSYSLVPKIKFYYIYPVLPQN